jgi:hypothetical protein
MNHVCVCDPLTYVQYKFTQSPPHLPKTKEAIARKQKNKEKEGIIYNIGACLKRYFQNASIRTLLMLTANFLSKDAE